MWRNTLRSALRLLSIRFWRWPGQLQSGVAFFERQLGAELRKLQRSSFAQRGRDPVLTLAGENGRPDERLFDDDIPADRRCRPVVLNFVDSIGPLILVTDDLEDHDRIVDDRGAAWRG